MPETYGGHCPPYVISLILEDRLVRVLDFGGKKDRAESGIQLFDFNPKSKIQNPKSKIQNPKSPNAPPHHSQQI
jgi:hypothetical protein